MNSDERMVIDALRSMSASMAALANEVRQIREVLTFRNRQELYESRRHKNKSRGVISESKTSEQKGKNLLDSQTPQQNVRDIINGRYIK